MIEGRFELREIEDCSSEMIKEMISTLPVIPETGSISLVYEPFFELKPDKNSRRRYLGLCKRFDIGVDSLIILDYDEQLKSFSPKREFKRNNFLSSCGKVCRIEARVRYVHYNLFRDSFLRKAFSEGYVIECGFLHFKKSLLYIGLYEKPGGLRFFLNQDKSEEESILLDWFENFVSRYKSI